MELAPTVLGSALSLCLLWFLVAFLWRDYRIDAFRQEIFAIRDELFDYAAQGNISFNDPAYGAVRTSMNRLIRFAHRITFTRALMSLLAQKVAPNPTLDRRLEAFYAPLNSLPEGPTKARLYRFHARAILAMGEFLVWSSPVLMTLLLAYSVKRVFSGAALKLRAAAFSKYVPGVKDLEAQAITYDPEAESPRRSHPMPA